VGRIVRQQNWGNGKQSTKRQQGTTAQERRGQAADCPVAPDGVPLAIVLQNHKITENRVALPSLTDTL